MTMTGTHRARAREWALGHASNGNEQVAVMFEITQGEFAGKSITWFGSFSDAAVDRTLDSLRHCGWNGDNFVELAGLDTNEVEIVVQAEEYQGKVRDKVRWVNRPSRLALREQMDPNTTSAFAARMRAKAIAHKQSYVGGVSGQTSTRSTSRPGQSGHLPFDGGGGAGGGGGGQHEPNPFGGSDDDIPF